MYALGLGVQRDDVRALTWMILGQESALHENPRDLWSDLTARTTPAQRREAERRAAEWRAKHGG